MPETLGQPCLLPMKVSTPEAWATQGAPELRQLFQEHMYGRYPTDTQPVSANIFHEDSEALGGKATLRQVRVHCGHTKTADLLLVFPNSFTTPSPCFVGLNFSGNYGLLDHPEIALPSGWVIDTYADAPGNRAGEGARARQKAAWSIQNTIERGYAVATFFSGDIVQDHPSLAEDDLRAFREPSDSVRGPSDTATLMAWAWGLSRMVDYLQSVPEIDGRRIATVGHSRHGKAALLAAAFDPRIALTIPSQAGCGGTAPSRVTIAPPTPAGIPKPAIETVEAINTTFPHWFADNFKTFNRAVEKLPFDQYDLIALCAPRPVLVSAAEEDHWSNPPGQFEMLRASDPIYRLLTGEGLDAERLPETGRLLDTRLGFFMRPGGHAMTATDWDAWLDYADRWLKPSSDGQPTPNRTF